MVPHSVQRSYHGPRFPAGTDIFLFTASTQATPVGFQISFIKAWSLFHIHLLSFVSNQSYSLLYMSSVIRHRSPPPFYVSLWVTKISRILLQLRGTTNKQFLFYVMMLSCVCKITVSMSGFARKQATAIFGCGLTKRRCQCFKPYSVK